MFDGSQKFPRGFYQHQCMPKHRQSKMQFLYEIIERMEVGQTLHSIASSEA